MRKQTFFLMVVIIFSTFFSMEVLANKATESYKLCKQKQGTTLSLYQRPTVHSGVLLKLSPNSKGIIKRKGRKKYKHSYWQEVSWNNKTGWIKNGCLSAESNSKSVAAQ